MSSPSTSSPPTGAQQMFPTGGGTWPGSSGAGGQQQQQQLAISNGVLLAAVIFLFMVVVFVFLLYLYAKRYLGANPLLGRSMSPSSRFIFVDASPVAGRGLPAAVLNALPVTVYGSNKEEGGTVAMECAVCLSEVVDGEKVRALPKCGHGFHVECIDMWFHSHDTCPLCRAPVEGLPRVPREEPAVEFPVFPTNVLFWGTHDAVTNAMPPPPVASSSSSSASGRRKENLVIDIPTRPAVTSSSPTTPLPTSRMPGADDMRSPVSARLRSLRRLLSRGKQAMMVGGTSNNSPRGGDIEQGLFAGAEAAPAPRPPKTPKTPPTTTT